MSSVAEQEPQGAETFDRSQNLKFKLQLRVKPK
jgi:hypothetical protein